MAGAWSTVSVKLCVASVPTPLCAVNVIGVGAARARRRRAAQDARRCGEGDAARQRARLAERRRREPVAVTVNDPAVPTVNVVLAALVNAGAWLTVSVKLCVASGRRRCSP